MKKINRFFVAAIVGIAAACSQELSDETPGVNTGNTEEAIPENYIELTFATNATDVKTSVDGNTVSWSEGDKILVCWDGDSMESNAVEIKDGMAYFTVSVDPEATDFYAVYPSTIAASVTDGSFSVTVPQSQSGRFADADIIVAKTTKDVLVYNFRHAVSLVKFVISDDNTKGITRAQFVDLANDSQLYGTMAITFDEDNQIATSTVTEDPTLDVIDVTAVQTGDNYMAVLPEKALAGFGLRLGSESKWHPGLVGENAITLGERLSLGTVDTKIHEGDYYIKTEATGKGNGTSWENAGDAALLQSLMGSYSDYTGKNLARGWRINGKTICVASGDYINPNGGNGFTTGYDNSYWKSGVSITIEGGYTSTGTSSAEAIANIGSSTEEAVAGRAFFLCGASNVTLKDLHINNHTRTNAAGGAAIYVKDYSNLSIQDCSIENNKLTANGSRHGGAIRMTGEGTLSISGTIFKNNSTDTAGGVLYADNTGAVTISGCTFESNTSGTHGGALFIADNATISGCIFTTNQSVKGGAITIGSVSTANISSCEFTENFANSGTKSHGGAVFNNGTATFSACAFSKNYVVASTAETDDTYGHGGAIYVSEEKTLTLNECSFTENYAPNGGAVNVAKNATTTVNQCKFVKNYSDGTIYHAKGKGRGASGTISNLGTTYFNSCEFKDNYALNNEYTGSITYTGYGNLGFNNCLFYNNDEEMSFWAIYSAGSTCVTNTTMIEKKANAALYITGNLYNSIIINTGGGSAIRGANSTLLHDYNLISSYYDSSITKATNEVIATSLDSGTYTENTSGMSYYLWSGTQDGFTQTTKENVASAIQSNTTFGADFYNWLDGLNALDYDIRGVARSNGYWPGSFQK